MRFVGLVLGVVLAGSPRAAQHTTEDARATVEDHVRRTAQESGGVFPVQDGADGRLLQLELVRISLVAAADLWKIHDPERRVGADAFFACAAFHARGDPAEKLYDVDLLVEPREGALVVTDVRVHKEMALVGGRWVWQERTTSGKHTR